MKANVLSKLPDSVALARLSALAGQVRTEVDEARKSKLGEGGSMDGFSVKRCPSPRPQFRRRYDARKRVPSQVQGPRSKVQSLGQRRWMAIEAHNQGQAQPGEVRLRDWLSRKATVLRIGRTKVHKMLLRGEFQGVTIRHVNLRLVFVSESPKSKVTSREVRA